MTVGQALERAEELRPGCKVDSRTRQRWLCEEDGMLRALLFSGCGMRAGVGADLAWPAEGGLDDAVELLVPVPFDALYPHYLPWARRNVTPGSRPGITAFWPS